jgi:hypothetical protein
LPAVGVLGIVSSSKISFTINNTVKINLTLARMGHLITQCYAGEIVIIWDFGAMTLHLSEWLRGSYIFQITSNGFEVSRGIITVTADDYLIRLTANVNQTVNIPSASSFKGRQLVFYKK